MSEEFTITTDELHRRARAHGRLLEHATTLHEARAS
jgi:hypothetical protein